MEIKKRMNDDLFESISQGSGFEEIAENRRIHEIANELRRCCQLYEAEFRGGKKDVSSFDIEQRAAEQYAKKADLWIPLADVVRLGVPGPSGNENDLYVSNDMVFKVNNLLNSGSIEHYLNRLILHNK